MLQPTLFVNTEGRMLLCGLALTGVMLLAFGIGWHLYPVRILPYAIMTGLNLIIGREAGMSFGYASGFSHAQVVALNILVESIQVLVIYPLFVQSTRHLITLRRLDPFITRIKHAAESGGGLVQKFGIAGLFVFVFMPFWMTGPVVGAIIGYLIGLRPWLNLAVVLGSTYIAIGLWALLLNELNAWAAAFNQSAPYALFIAILLIAAAMQWLGRHNHKKHRRQGH